MKESFNIVEVLENGANRWLVRGRAYTDITVGEKIYLPDAQGQIVSESSPEFVITTILSYGKFLQFVNSMMTAELTIEGRDGEQLLQSQMLYKL